MAGRIGAAYLLSACDWSTPLSVFKYRQTESAGDRFRTAGCRATCVTGREERLPLPLHSPGCPAVQIYHGELNECGWPLSRCCRRMNNRQSTYAQATSKRDRKRKTTRNELKELQSPKQEERRAKSEWHNPGEMPTRASAAEAVILTAHQV